MLFVGIHTLLLCITRGYGYRSLLTSDATLEQERRTKVERADAARRGQLGGDGKWMRADTVTEDCRRPSVVLPKLVELNYETFQNE